MKTNPFNMSTQEICHFLEGRLEQEIWRMGAKPAKEKFGLLRNLVPYDYQLKSRFHCLIFQVLHNLSLCIQTVYVHVLAEPVCLAFSLPMEILPIFQSYLIPFLPGRLSRTSDDPSLYYFSFLLRYYITP